MNTISIEKFGMMTYEELTNISGGQVMPPLVDGGIKKQKSIWEMVVDSLGRCVNLPPSIPCP